MYIYVYIYTYIYIYIYIYISLYIAFSGFKKISYSILIIGRNKLMLLMDRTWINETECA